MKPDFYNYDFINIDGNMIHRTAMIYPNVGLGKGNVIGAYTVIGSNGEMRRPKDFNGTVTEFQETFQGNVSIGDNNVISEHVTIQRPHEFASTYVGSNNIIMAHSHLGHNVIVNDNCEICTGVILGGYVIVKNGARLKLGVTVRNRLIIGEGATIGMQAAVIKDVPDGATVMGVPAK